MPLMTGLDDAASVSSETEDRTSVLQSNACPAHACAPQSAMFSEQKVVVAHESVSTDAVFFDSSSLRGSR